MPRPPLSRLRNRSRVPQRTFKPWSVLVFPTRYSIYRLVVAEEGLGAVPCCEYVRQKICNERLEAWYKMSGLFPVCPCSRDCSEPHPLPYPQEAIHF